MDKDPIFISVVIPVYNEQNRIHSFLSSVIEYVRKKDFSYEIVIVDDGSSDDTVIMVESLLKEKLSGKYKILKLPVNLGKGAAIKKGMLEAAGEYIFFLDADGSTSIKEIDSFISHFSSRFDIFIATRTIKHKAPFKRKIFGYGYIYLANFMLQLSVPDITCGFKCYRQRCAHEIFSRQTLNNWSFDAEDLFIARKHGYRIKTLPVKWKHTGGSKVKVLKNVFACGLDLFRIRFYDIKGMYS
ncbi:MAG: glycosyltransferase [Deltaproteobacteria bacterium]|nr:glycosyltransferase [Deltaproteobacteria bacterium]